MIKETILPADYINWQHFKDNKYFFRWNPVEIQVGDTPMIQSDEATITLPLNCTYGELVTMLIRCQYTADAEMALSANMRKDPQAYAAEDAAFQSWREYCKDIARQHFGLNEP